MFKLEAPHSCCKGTENCTVTVTFITFRALRPDVGWRLPNLSPSNAFASEIHLLDGQVQPQLT